MERVRLCSGSIFNNFFNSFLILKKTCKSVRQIRQKEDEIESFSIDSLLILINNTKIHDETQFYKTLKICSDFFEINEIIDSDKINELFEIIKTKLTKKGHKNPLFALKLLHIFLSNHKEIDFEQNQEFLRIIIEIFKEQKNDDLIEQILLIFQDLINISQDFAKFLLEQIDLIDFCFNSLTFNSLSLISELFNLDNDLIAELGLGEQIPQLLEIFSHHIKSINDPLTLILLLQILKQFINLNIEISVECFNNFGLWEDIYEILDISNADIKINAISLLTLFIQNNFIDFYSAFHEKMIEMFIYYINNQQKMTNSKILISLFDFFNTHLQNYDEYFQEIISKEIHKLILEQIHFYSFVLQEKSIEFLFIIFNSNPNILKQVDFTDFSFVDILINMINEFLTDPDDSELSLYYQKSCVLLQSLITIEKANDNSTLIDYCLDNINMDELHIKNDEISLNLLSTLNEDS